ncbi:putative 5'-3' exonuclease protein [Rhizobium phage RHph_Y1_20]|uniref:Putative 5'-3' exonuclease protein n=1 Tax=Rhizobium phage RHph_Y1_20 TaxID=2509571 RepID=A0A7S5QYM5_9CAUD|nr:putative 5'-3' exonuclease protein [Rhizobium phage RHph_Y1_20]
MTDLSLDELLMSGDLDGLAHEESYPETIPGRTVHIDADFVAYHISYEKPDDPKTIDDMQHNAEVIIEHMRRAAAAEHVHMHLTPSTSDKGGRYSFAIQKPYQGNRDDKAKPRLLHIMRQWLSDRYPGTLHEFCEADDGMSSAQYLAIEQGNTALSIIASKDKDLRMVPGWHMVWDTGELVFVDPAQPFGWVELVERTSASGQVTKQLKGYGHKWFWAQMLIGDQADNVQGLPKITGKYMNSIQPTAPVIEARKILANEQATDKQKQKAIKALNDRKAGLCGPATAILLLDLVHDNPSALLLIKSLYESYGNEIGFIHHQTGEPVRWDRVFLSEARMLWMRRERTNPDCVLNFLQEIALEAQQPNHLRAA